MRDVTNENFGLLMAYVLPGFVTLSGISFFSETVRRWLGTSSQQSPTVGGFLYVTLGAIAAGLMVSTIRWMLIDRIHHRTGIHQPTWEFSALGNKLAAFELLVASHYFYYKFHANMLVAVAFTFFAYAMGTPNRGLGFIGISLSFVIVETVLWVGSRDTLRKYYQRTNALLQR